MNRAAAFGLLALALAWAPVRAADLFDGKSLDGWGDAQGRENSDWQVKDGMLYFPGHAEPGKQGQTRKRDLYAQAVYGDFRLTAEWAVCEGGNSGIKYRVADYGRKEAVGLEYQIIGQGHPEEKNPTRTVGGMYDLFSRGEEAGQVKINPSFKRGEAPTAENFNTTVILAEGTRIRHFLNGRLLVDIDTESEEFKAAHAQSKYRKVKGFGSKPAGQILLQDHGDEVYFRKFSVTAP